MFSSSETNFAMQILKQVQNDRFCAMLALRNEIAFPREKWSSKDVLLWRF